MRGQFGSAQSSIHGTVARYRNGRCRCDLCKDAVRLAAAARRKQRKADAESGFFTGTHGTVSTYNNGGCRCDECKAAVRAYDRQLYERTKAERRTP